MLRPKEKRGLGCSSCLQQCLVLGSQEALHPQSKSPFFSQSEVDYLFFYGKLGRSSNSFSQSSASLPHCQLLLHLTLYGPVNANLLKIRLAVSQLMSWPSEIFPVHSSVLRPPKRFITISHFPNTWASMPIKINEV